jgi:adenylosuccinate lyase
VARDGLVETVQFLGLVTGTLGKIGYDVMLMMATEIGEALEPFESHRGASSTVPRKRIPISSEVMLANSKTVHQHAGLMLDAMVQAFERATGPWHAEWVTLPESFILTAGALAQARFMLEGLVDARRMRTNLDSTRGLIVAEAVMMGLAPHLGRQQAHDTVYATCRQSLADDHSLFEVLNDNASVNGALRPTGSASSPIPLTTSEPRRPWSTVSSNAGPGTLPDPTHPSEETPCSNAPSRPSASWLPSTAPSYSGHRPRRPRAILPAPSR